MEIVKVILTSFLSVAALFFITKIMGHKQLAQLDFFDYITGITIGSVAAELATELEQPERPLIALAVYGAVSVALSLITHKLPRTRKFINGSPTIVMSGGKLYRKNMKEAKLDLSEFMVMCREAGYFDLSEVHTAVFEHNGRLSILPVAKKRPLTPEDMNISPEEQHISTEVIMDGRIMGENLLRMGLDERWLRERLKERGYKSEREIFLGTVGSERELTLYPVDENL